MKLLIVEDERELLTDLIDLFHLEGFLCEGAVNVFEAKEKIYMYDYDAMILDLGLPDGNGLDILVYLKQLNKKTGVLILSAKNALDDKINGLDIGADDYLTKPFDFPELNARIKSIIRRKHFDGSNILKFSEVEINTNSQEVKINDKSIFLTQKEYELLLFFISNKNRVITRESIVEHLWGDDTDLFNSFDFIYNHIKNLRKKMMNAGGNNYIKAIYGVGYKFEKV
ncbi:MAG: DNA-binding response regulator [Bacteroidetes bacterium]|nr:MAG: DNA-binding response regulator [Bacteroidota bacterium]